MLYCICGLCCRKIRHFHCRKTDNNENMSRPACKAVLSKAVGFACDLTRRRRTPGHSPGVRRMGRTVCKTVPCYILSLIRGTAITSPLVKIRQDVVIIRTLPIICGTHQFHSFFPLSLFYAAATYGILIVICKVNVFLPIPTYHPR